MFPCRAQKRIAQQRIDSKMPLGRIIDIRKKVFADVKVRLYHTLLSALPTRYFHAELRKSGLADRR